MPPYRARLGGAFGGGTQRQERPQIDIASIIDAIGRGATTSIQNAYLRKRQTSLDQQTAQEKADAKLLAQQDRDEQRAREAARVAEVAKAFDANERYRAAQLQLERDKLAQPKPEPAPRQVTDPVKGDVFNVQGGQATPVLGPDGKPFRLGVPQKAGDTPPGVPKGRTMPAGTLEKIGMLRDMETAARQLPEFLAGKGNVSGPVLGRLPGFARDLISPGGIEARQLAASIEGQYYNLISGAAVSASEAARLQPFVPSKNDDEEVLKRKAVFFAERLKQIVNARLAEFKKAGYAVDAPGDGRDAPEDIFTHYGLERKE